MAELSGTAISVGGPLDAAGWWVKDPNRPFEGMINLTNPTQPGMVARVVVTGRTADNHADPEAQFERNFGRHMAVTTALGLLERADIADELLAPIRAAQGEADEEELTVDASPEELDTIRRLTDLWMRPWSARGGRGGSATPPPPPTASTSPTSPVSCAATSPPARRAGAGREGSLGRPLGRSHRQEGCCALVSGDRHLLELAPRAGGVDRARAPGAPWPGWGPGRTGRAARSAQGGGLLCATWPRRSSSPWSSRTPATVG